VFNKQTVVILGAGASAEFNMPLGSTLVSNISLALVGANAQPDPLLVQEMMRFLDPDHAKKLLKLGPWLARILPQFASIDEALHFLSDQPDIVELGKIAIAHEIMKAERSSLLHSAVHFDHGPSIKDCTNSWANKFLTMLLSGSRRAEITKPFTYVKFIDFNYDHILPHFLFWALRRNFHVTPQVAAECVNKLTILHPYGSLGPLNWQSETDVVSFGETDGNLAEIARRVKTYTEEVASPQRELIRTVLEEAQVFIVIGFGYHAQNVQILSTDREHKGAAFMTVFGIPDGNHEAIKTAMKNSLRCHEQPRLFARTGRQMLDEAGISISFAAS
jgi:hypothetical protein